MSLFESALVVIVTFNSENDIRECLKSLLAQKSIRPTIVVVDNASNDRTTEIVARDFPEVHLIRNSMNTGYTGGCNIGMKKLHSAYVAFVNPDTLIHPEWLRVAISTLNSGRNIGACQPKILLHEDNTRLNSRGNQANFLFFAWPDGYGDMDREEVESRKIPYASGAAAVYKRECLNGIGQFDELYFMYHDDVDLGTRGFLLGWDTLYSPKSLVVHKYRYRETPEKFYLIERNRIITLMKTYRKVTILSMLPIIMTSECGIVVKSLCEGWTVEKIRGYFSIAVNLKHILRERSRLQSCRVRTDRELLELLRGGVYFAPAGDSPTVQFGNVLLEKCRVFLLGLRAIDH